MNKRHDDYGHSFLDRYWWLYAISIGCLLFFAIQAFGAVTADWRVNLLKGTTTIATVSGVSADDAWSKCQAQIPKSATTSTAYRCQTLVYAATVTPDPVCPPKPADETQTAQCVAPLTGSWTQVRAYISAPPPICWTAGPWTPTDAPSGACSQPPPPPVDCVVSEWGAWVQGTPSACVAGSQTRTDDRTRTVITQPANGGAACPSLSESQTVTLACTVTPPTGIAAPVVTATQSANVANPANVDVKLSWNALAGATSYKLQRCTGANCNASFTQLVWAAPLTYTNNNLPAGFTFGYRVQGTTSSSQGQWSTTLYVITTAGPPPPPPPPAVGTATIDWTHDGKNTDGTIAVLAGFRVIYGTAPNALTQLVTVSNPAARTYVVDKLGSGTWYFAVRAYTAAGGESDQSNVATKAIP